MTGARAFDPEDDLHVQVYDEAPLWSAAAGGLLLEHVPLSARRALDLACGTGFPLLELAERLGPRARVVGLDPWLAGLRRADHKRSRWPVANADLVAGDGARMPFDDRSFDLVVSSLGLNNFDQPEAALREVSRVLTADGVLALATNLMGHMKELYRALERAVADDPAALERLRVHEQHRGTLESHATRLAGAGLRVTTTHRRATVLRFAGAEALFEHHFMRLGFRAGWEEVAGHAIRLDRLRGELDAVAREQGELRLTIPLVYVEARRS